MVLAGIELTTQVYEADGLTTRLITYGFSLPNQGSDVVAMNSKLIHSHPQVNI